MTSRVLQNNDYIIETPYRRKKQQQIHVNRIKLYHRRNPEKVSMTISNVHICETPVENLTLSWSSVKISEIAKM